VSCWTKSALLHAGFQRPTRTYYLVIVLPSSLIRRLTGLKSEDGTVGSKAQGAYYDCGGS
jgi:hypothetical protein